MASRRLDNARAVVYNGLTRYRMIASSSGGASRIASSAVVMHSKHCSHACTASDCTSGFCSRSRSLSRRTQSQAVRV
eukprot:10820-Eustigmatos_ZCMA.PRE.1